MPIEIQDNRNVIIQVSTIFILQSVKEKVWKCCEKPTQYTHHALLDVDSVHFSRAPRNSSRLWTQDFMMNVECLVI